MSTQLERLKEEEEQMEAQMFGNPVEEPVTPQVQEPEAAPKAEEPEKPSTDWEKRYKNYKASTDSTIYSLRREIMDLKSDLATAMEARVNTPEQEVDIFADTFTQDDVDTFGTEGLEVVKKAANALVEKSVKPLQEKLSAAEKKSIDALKKQSEADRQKAYGDFLSRLESIVPNYRDLNVDKKFLEWMKLPDTYSGLNRSELFRRAEASGDVQRVADFFVEFEAANKVTTKPELEAIETHITPVGGGSAAVSTSTRNTEEYIYTSEIDKFYNDLMKGRYEGRQNEVMAIEQKIDHAQMNGLIRKG